jgi:hypothetical protein
MTEPIPVTVDMLPDRAVYCTNRSRSAIHRIPDEFERPIGPYPEEEAWRYDHCIPACAVHDGQYFEHHSFLEVDMDKITKTRRELCSNPACFGRLKLAPESQLTRVTERVRSLLG